MPTLPPDFGEKVKMILERIEQVQPQATEQDSQSLLYFASTLSQALKWAEAPKSEIKGIEPFDPFPALIELRAYCLMAFDYHKSRRRTTIKYKNEDLCPSSHAYSYPEFKASLGNMQAVQELCFCTEKVFVGWGKDYPTFEDVKDSNFLDSEFMSEFGQYYK